jgi:hypothetical protein
MFFSVNKKVSLHNIYFWDLQMKIKTESYI